MSFKFVPKKDYNFEKGRTYYLFDNGEVLVPTRRVDNWNTECKKL